VQQGVDADGAGRRGAAEDRLQVRHRVGEMGKGARRPGGGGCRLDQDGEECLGIRRLGIEQLAQQAGRADEVFQVAGVARVVEQTESTQRGLAGQGLAQGALGDREGRAQARPIDARGGLLVATQDEPQRLVGVALDEIGEDLQVGPIQSETLAEDREHGRRRLRRVGRRQAGQDAARDALEQPAQTPAQDGIVRRLQGFVVRVRPGVVRVATDGVGQEGRDLLGLEQRQTQGPERAECGSVVELGIRASQSQGIARGPPRRGRHGGEVLAPECAGLGHAQTSRVQGCRRRPSKCQVSSSPRAGPLSMKRPRTRSSGSLK
jgi:hypothetical protein